MFGCVADGAGEGGGPGAMFSCVNNTANNTSTTPSTGSKKRGMTDMLDMIDTPEKVDF